MSPELTDDLVGKYPQIFRNINGDVRRTPMALGIECGDGWHGLLDQCCRRIMATKVPEDFAADQVKEKWGGLRVYVTAGTEDIYKILSDIESQSFWVCEQCGDDGEVVSRRGWLKTLCKKCEEASCKKREV